jgi:hypothetical protein
MIITDPEVLTPLHCPGAVGKGGRRDAGCVCGNEASGWEGRDIRRYPLPHFQGGGRQWESVLLCS